MAIPEPTSFWNFDESVIGSNAADATATGNTLTNNGVTPFTTGLIGNAADIELTGGLQWFSHTDTASLSPTGDMSLAIWVNFESTGERSLMGVWNATPSYAFLTSSGTQVQLIIWNSGGSSTTVSWNVSAFSTATWYHLAVVYTAATHTSEFYLNGSSQGTRDSVRTDIRDSNEDFTIGKLVGAITPMDGLVDMAGIWNGTVLSASDVTALYNGGAGVQYPFGAGTATPHNLVTLGVGT